MKGKQQLGLPVAGKSREPDDLALTGSEGKSGRLMLEYDRGGCEFPRGALERVVIGNAAHRLDKAMVVELGGRPLGHDSSVLHDNDAIRGPEDFVQDVRDEDDRTAARDEAPDMVEHLARKARVKRRGGLVENDEARGNAGIGEGHGDLDHLAFGDRQVAHRLTAVDSVAPETPRPGLSRSPSRPSRASRSRQAHDA